MKKRSLIQENIFATLAKMLAALQIEKKIGDAMEKVADAPEIKDSMSRMRTATDHTIKLLKDYCKRNPDDVKCKDNDKGK